MGSSSSHPPGNATNERGNSKLSHPLIKIIGPISNEDTSLNLVKESDDVDKRSNMSAHQTGIEKESAHDEISQSRDNVETETKELAKKNIQSEKGRIFRSLNNAINTIHLLQNSVRKVNHWSDLRKSFACISSIGLLIQNIGSLPVEVVKRYQLEAGQMMSNTESINLMCTVVTNGWQNCSETQGSNKVETPYDVMIAALLALWNFSDWSPEVTYDIVGDPNFLDTLKAILTAYSAARVNGENMPDNQSNLVESCLSIINNVSNVEENVIPLRDHGFVSIVSPYLDSKTLTDRFKTLATLANMLDENESVILQEKHDLLKIYLTLLEKALKNKNHLCELAEGTWSAWECALTIHHLARNHANKELLVKMGCLPPLVDMSKIGTVEEKREAVGAIRLLAFDQNNQKIILEDKDLNIVDVLIDITETSEDKVTKERADGTLWLLREELQKNEKYKSKVNSYLDRNKGQAIAKPKSSIGTAVTKQEKGHIMISYSWSQQKELINIKNKLTELKYPVWMDIDKMVDSTTQAMAEAVEMASVVLICMSQKYKESENCKQEAEYAYQLRKKIVPLKMEADYKADGWLGFIVAGKMFYDFSGKYEFETKFNDLLKELAVQPGQHKGTGDVARISNPTSSLVRPDPHTSLSDVRKWRRKNVNHWLDQNNLSRREFGHLTGKDIAALVRMKDQAAHYFYGCLKRELKIRNLSTIDTFINALERL